MAQIKCALSRAGMCDWFREKKSDFLLRNDTLQLTNEDRRRDDDGRLTNERDHSRNDELDWA